MLACADVWVARVEAAQYASKLFRIYSVTVVLEVMEMFEVFIRTKGRTVPREGWTLLRRPSSPKVYAIGHAGEAANYKLKRLNLVRICRCHSRMLVKQNNFVLEDNDRAHVLIGH
jgi:hypothetical protein